MWHWGLFMAVDRVCVQSHIKASIFALSLTVAFLALTHPQMAQAQTVQGLQGNTSDGLSASGSSAQSGPLIGPIEAAFSQRNTDPLAVQAQLLALKAQAEADSDIRAIALATHYLAVLGHHFAEYTQTEAMVDAALLAYRQQLEPSERGTLELWQGHLWYRLGNAERAQTRFRALEQEFRGEPLLADVLLSQSVLAHAQGIYDESVAKGLAALRLYEAQGNINGQIQAHKDLGIDYLAINDLESSLFHFEAGKALLEQSEDVFVAVVLSANMGITLQRLGDLEGAMDAYKWTHDSAVVLNRPLTQAQSLLNIGTMYNRDLKDDRQAIDYYQRSLAISEAHGLSFGVMLNHLNIGVSLGALGQTDEALASFDRAFVVADQLDRPNERQALLGQKAEVLAKAGRYQEAFEASQAQKEIAETLFNESRDRAIADLRVEYETELAEQALALAQAKNAQQSQWIRFLWVVVALLVALVGMGGGFLLYRNRSLRELYERNVELLDQFYGAEGRQSLGEDADQDPMKGLFDRLLAMLETDALFKDEQLSLTGLARQAQSNEKYISQAISRYANMNFANFINFYRINEAKKLLRSADDKLGITDVMLECGFSHKSTFYAAFKKFTGMTPTQFRAVAQQESSRVSPKSENIGAVAL